MIVQSRANCEVDKDLGLSHLSRHSPSAHRLGQQPRFSDGVRPGRGFSKTL